MFCCSQRSFEVESSKFDRGDLITNFVDKNCDLYGKDEFFVNKQFLDSSISNEEVCRALLRPTLRLKTRDRFQIEDKLVAQFVFRYFGWALFYATDSLKGDKEVVQVAVSSSGRALGYASNLLQQDEHLSSLAKETYERQKSLNA